MKIIITGCTGFIGSEVLHQSLAMPEITSIVVISRRALTPSPETSNPKLKVLIKKDFTTYSEAEMQDLADADGCIWAMGSKREAPVNVEIDYPFAFVKAISQTLSTRTKSFHYVHLGGKYISEDQTKSLLIMQEGRRNKGRAVTQLLQYANEPAAQGKWETTVFKPSFVLENQGVWAMLAPIAGNHHSVKVGELAAAMIDSAMNGAERRVFDNADIVKRGREVWGKN